MIIQLSMEHQTCLWQPELSSDPNVFSLDIAELENREGKETLTHKVGAGQDGVYGLIFVRCSPKVGSVSFTLDVDFYNPGPDYLGTGLSPLPTLYFALSFVYAAGLVAFV